MGPDHGPLILGVCWTFMSLSIIAVFLRILVRTRHSSLSGRDDVTIVLSLVVTIVYVSVNTAAIAYGAGHHPWDIPPDQVETALHLLTVGPPFAVLAFSIPKLAVIFLIHRVFEPPKLHRVILYSMCVVLFALCAVNIVLVFVQCSPTAILWNPSLLRTHPGAHCWPADVVVFFSIAFGAYSAFMDFSLALYPIFRIANLQTSRQRKITIGILFSLGAVAGVVAIVKCTKFRSLEAVDDLTYATANLVIWGAIEANVLIIAASIPALGPLFNRKAYKRWLSAGRRNSRHLDDLYDRNGYPKKMSSFKRASSLDEDDEEEADVESSRSTKSTTVGKLKADARIPLNRQISVTESEVEGPSSSKRETVASDFTEDGREKPAGEEIELVVVPRE